MTGKNEGAVFRGIIGLVALAGAMGGFFALFVVEIPARNENALLLALGFVMGWAGSVIASEYGSTSTGRKVAESAIRDLDRKNVAAAGEPQSVEVVNTPEKPVPTTEAGA